MRSHPIATSAGRAGDGSVRFVSPLDKGKSPFKNDTMPRNPYSSQNGYGGYSSHRAKEDEEDESLGGEIISPRNADRRRQALVDKISPLDIVRLGNVRYHGGVHGYHP
jgi:hypothetical protein